MNATETVGEINAILTRYRVPMDDRMLVLDKVEQAIQEASASASRAAEAERERSQAGEFQRLEERAAAEEGTSKAYQRGLEQGLAETSSVVPILVIVALCLVVAILILRR